MGLAHPSWSTSRQVGHTVEWIVELLILNKEVVCMLDQAFRVCFHQRMAPFGLLKLAAQINEEAPHKDCTIWFLW